MALTAAQRATLRADILADPVFGQLPKNGDTDFDIALAYNQLASPDFLVWNTATPVRAILDSFSWTAFTPNDTPDGTAAFTNRILVIQTKQMNLQLMLQGRDTVDASLANFRSGLRDALINVPSGTGGANVNVAGANATNALNACTRRATRAEKVFANAAVSTGGVSAAILTYIGAISPADVAEARAN